MNVLNTSTEYTLAVWAGIAMVAVVGITGIFITFMIVRDEKTAKVIGAAVLSTIIAIVAIVGLAVFAREKHVRIEATISDEASFNDIYSKYEIVETRGKIYILEERKQQK